MPSSRSDKSRVSPAGTSMSFRMISEQDFLLAVALAAEVKVQVDALLSRREARLGEGAAETKVAASAIRDIREECISNK